MANTFRGIVRDLSGKNGQVVRGRVVEGSEDAPSPVVEKGEPVVTAKTQSG